MIVNEKNEIKNILENVYFCCGVSNFIVDEELLGLYETPGGDKPVDGDIIVNWSNFQGTEGITIAIGSTIDECFEKAFYEITEKFDVLGRNEVIHMIGVTQAQVIEQRLGYKLTGSILDDGFISVEKVEVAN